MLFAPEFMAAPRDSKDPAGAIISGMFIMIVDCYPLITVKCHLSKVVVATFCEGYYYLW